MITLGTHETFIRHNNQQSNKWGGGAHKVDDLRTVCDDKCMIFCSRKEHTKD